MTKLYKLLLFTSSIYFGWSIMVILLGIIYYFER